MDKGEGGEACTCGEEGEGIDPERPGGVAPGPGKPEGRGADGESLEPKLARVGADKL